MFDTALRPLDTKPRRFSMGLITAKLLGWSDKPRRRTMPELPGSEHISVSSRAAASRSPWPVQRNAKAASGIHAGCAWMSATVDGPVICRQPSRGRTASGPTRNCNPRRADKVGDRPPEAKPVTELAFRRHVPVPEYESRTVRPGDARRASPLLPSRHDHDHLPRPPMAPAAVVHLGGDGGTRPVLPVRHAVRRSPHPR